MHPETLRTPHDDTSLDCDDAPPFKICPKCRFMWCDRQDFLEDPHIEIVGYQAHFEELKEGLFLFNHSCKGTLSIHAARFEDLYDGPIFAERATGGPECPGFCLHKHELAPCTAKCECAYVREIIRIIREWPRKHFPKEISIPKEKAVFWLDRHGNWRNVHGRFRNKRIIDHFNRSIRRDDVGYYVTQSNGDILEKVYFHHEDTALFVVDVSEDGDSLRTTLNTGDSMVLDPAALRVKDDQLYLILSGETVRFAERALMRIAARLDCASDRYFIETGGRRFEIPPLDSSQAP